MSKKIILCPNCGAINRVSLDEKSGLAAHCGKCQEKLSLNPSLVSVTGTKLNKIITNSKLPVFVDVYADWCGPCKSYGPIFEKVSKQMWLQAEFYKIDSDKEQSFSSQFGVRGLPTTLIFNKGVLIKSQSGLLNETQLQGLINQFIAG
jgi:thioredoxin 2